MNQIQLVNIADIVVKPTLNPRTRLDKTADAELLKSIQHRASTLGADHAIILPLAITMLNVLADGERRLTAAKLAGLTQVPCITLDVTNEEIYNLRLDV